VTYAGGRCHDAGMIRLFTPGQGRRAAALLAGIVLGVSAMLAAPSAAVAVDATVTITGHGYGHGRGMGQYGAYGYAVNLGWSYQSIVAHYYSNTTMSNTGNPVIDVELMAMTAKDAPICAPGLTVNGTAVGKGCVLVRRASQGTFTVFAANGYSPGTDPGWAQWASLSSGLAIGTTADPANLANLLRVWDSASSSHGYRGTLVAADPGGMQYLLNRVPAETYLRGVLPREVPASWGSAGSGKGMQALEAQAVAARSYALSGSTRTSGAKICDSTACQVYGGAFTWAVGAASPTASENSLTDTAAANTAGQVLWLNGAIARTEFSSSTGGWTAGGTFPAVVDDGDSTSNNPYHNWTTSTTLSAIASALGTGAIGTITVTGRNGLGADGGRVTQVTVVTTSGARSTFTGAQIRTALGLRSDWFSMSGINPAEAQKVVKSLYADILGRAVDPGGLDTWTSQILLTGSAGTTATGLSTSDERLTVFVAAQYQAALHRDPEPAGLTFWVRKLQSGWTVPDLQAGIYGSDESLTVLGNGNLNPWIAAMYSSLLGRTAGAAEVAWWADYSAKNGRQATVAGISHSEEAAGVRLKAYYETMLGRAPDPSGIASFVPVLMQGRGDFLVPVYIGQSTEYWARAQTRF
jgi:SpoIID/LytB domain protein